LGYLDWIDNNVAYAQTKLPKISSPSGLLIVGAREGLDLSAQQKLRALNMNSRRIELVTYDDLIGRSRNLYQSVTYASIPD
jgi:hypothetical protein